MYEYAGNYSKLTKVVYTTGFVVTQKKNLDFITKFVETINLFVRKKYIFF